MDRRRGLFFLIFLILILGVVDAAWVIYYKQTITANIIGREKVFTIVQEFDSDISMDTSSNSNQTITTMKIGNISENAFMSFVMETRRTNLTSQEDCPNYDKDCNITVSHLYNNNLTEIRTIISSKQNINNENNFTLFKNVDNIIEYEIQCVEDSCPQRIKSNITLEQIPNYF